MSKLPRFLKRRREVARYYLKAFAKTPGLRLQSLLPDREHAWHLFTIQVAPEKRRALYDFLNARGILANVHYIPVHTMPFYQRRGWKGRRVPNAEAYYAGALSLPMHAALTDAEAAFVVKTVRQGLAA